MVPLENSRSSASIWNRRDVATVVVLSIRGFLRTADGFPAIVQRAVVANPKPRIQDRWMGVPDNTERYCSMLEKQLFSTWKPPLNCL